MNRTGQQQPQAPRAPPGFPAAAARGGGSAFPPAYLPQQQAARLPAGFGARGAPSPAPFRFDGGGGGGGAFDTAEFPPLGAAPAPAPAPGFAGPPPPRAFTPDEFPALGAELDADKQRWAGFAPNGKPSTNGRAPPPAPAPAPAPQTAAQQVLASGADRWGLLGLVALLRGDGAALALGADLGAMGLDMGAPRALFPAFATPWDAGGGAPDAGEFALPACYALATPPPGPSKASTFGDETLFWAFYASARDALQEVAAQELWNRGWRWHKEQRLWLTKEGMPAAHAKVPGGEAGPFVVWDADAWTKDVRELSVAYADLEEKAQPAFPPTATLTYPGQQPPPPGPGAPAAAAAGGRPFQGAGIAAM